MFLIFNFKMKQFYDFFREISGFRDSSYRPFPLINFQILKRYTLENLILRGVNKMTFWSRTHGFSAISFLKFYEVGSTTAGF